MTLAQAAAELKTLNVKAKELETKIKSKVERLEAENAELMGALKVLLPFLSTEAQLLDNASLNDGVACEFDTASVHARKVYNKVLKKQKKV
jgi:hypothetical protein